MKRGFTLLEMLIVIGIIAALIAASSATYTAVVRQAEKSKCLELVHNVATALQERYLKEGVWRKSIAYVGEHGGLLDADNARYLVRGEKYFSLNYDSTKDKLVGFDRFGIVTPWAMKIIKSRGNSVSLSTKVSVAQDGGHTISDHILRFAIDTDGDGLIKNVNIGGETITVRAQAIVWCGGADGRIEKYSLGIKGDDIYSWAPGQRQR